MVEQAIRDATRRFEEAFNQGDTAAAIDFYTDDAVLLPPNMETISGKEAIAAFWNVAIAMGIRGVNIETIEVGYEGDLAYERGVNSITIQPEGGQAVTEKGKYLVIWKRQADGSWKMAIDMFNSDPAPLSP